MKTNEFSLRHPISKSGTSDPSQAPAFGNVLSEFSSPSTIINILLLLVILASSFLGYWDYSHSWVANHNIYLDVVAGTAQAPEQYRVGVIDLAQFMAVHGHQSLRAALGLIDFLTEGAAVFLLLSLVRRSPFYRGASLPVQWIGEGIFLVLVQYYLAWLLWYHRPETLTSAALLACALVLLSRPLADAAGGKLLTAFLLLLVTVAQSLVRADVIFAFHLGVLAVCLLRSRPGFVLGRRFQAATSLLSVTLAVLIQYSLMHRFFPHASYGSTAVIQMRHNLVNVIGYVPFLIFMLPFFWTLLIAVRERARVSSASLALLLGGFIFFCMWSVVGILQEVRIFLPFALVAAPTTVLVFLQQMKPLEQVDSLEEFWAINKDEAVPVSKAQAAAV